ncbi:MAG: SH3 domain-containing protein, partial [Arenicellales bacterium]
PAINVQPGAVLSAKLNSVKVFSEPDKASDVVGRLGKGEEVVFVGEKNGDFLLVQGNEAEGWVQEILLQR